MLFSIVSWQTGPSYGWSNVERFVHAVDSTTHGNMFAASSMAGIERTLEELAKLPAGPAIPDIEHHDHLWLSLMHGGKSASASGGLCVDDN